MSVIEVWFSLLRLRSDILRHFTGNLYIILDSLDNMYNLIANLPSSDSKELYVKFTKRISKIVDKDDPRIETFCFGVSPYLIQELRTAVVYSIIDEKNELGEYFSLSDSSIQIMILDLNILEDQRESVMDQCKSVSKFQYNSNVYINPYLCISYLRSLKENGAKFSINLSPRSLWMKCIFEENDLNILYDVLSSKGTDRKFGMAVSMYTMCTLPEMSKDRQLYYPLFIFDGLFSCLEKENNTYSLFPSNESSKMVLDYHLELLHLKKFKIPISKRMSVFDDYLNGNFQSFCNELSDHLMTMSPYLIKEEKPYHTYMAAFTSPLRKLGYKVFNNLPFGLIKPDSAFWNAYHAAFIEYKHVIPPDFIPKKARLVVKELDENSRCKLLEEFYKGLENVKKPIIIKLCQDIIVKTRVEQIPKYAFTLASYLKKDVEVNIMLFYIHNVILLHCMYYRETKSFSEYKIFASEGYFDDKDLKSIKDAK